ncbi:hypothetical protein [Xylanibacter ruminicola]|uniref:Uncharacterized protein n=1 Tax=Xylanibacter ruminicola TaxID=839 RepID=A0A1M6YKN9_XYLRU|nr:hypothetical protein [Xylanibacter ruminicola]SHL18683.1 hypothetical protein SAMN05216463_1298 [Xylanibacter ruminicola]
MDIERKSNGQENLAARIIPRTFAPASNYSNTYNMNNNEELISLLKRLHEKLHQADDNKQSSAVVILPASLRTARAKEIWKKAQDAGYIDENYQPLLTRTQAAVFAYEMAAKLKIRNKWKIFESFWNRSNMRSNYYRALYQQQYSDFVDELKKL